MPSLATGRGPRAALWAALLLAGGLPLPLEGQRYDTRVEAPRDRVDLSPRFEVDYTTPALHKWYASRSLAGTYASHWYDTGANYARDRYLRYLDPFLAGEEWYDSFGEHLGRGWLVYSWEQVQPSREGSDILWPQFPGAFQGLAIASDRRGGETYRLMVGSVLDVQLTPLTLRKPGFEGVRLDYARDRLESTLLLSRPSQPTGPRRNVTHLMGGRLGYAPFAAGSLGLTYVNLHNSNTEPEFRAGNPLAGVLTSNQNRTPDRLWVQVRDDSPADGVGGARVFRHDIVFTDTNGVRISGRDLGLLPVIEGGRLREGALVVDGSERLLLEYDLRGLSELGLDPRAVTAAAVELAVANDYRIELATNLQTDGLRNPETVFLPYARAEGNVRDESNGRVLLLDYGLPTANELIGFDWDLVDWHGLSVQGETVLNRQHRRYPNPRLSRHHEMVRTAWAAYGIAAWNLYPWGLFLETFSMDDAYSTSHWLTLGNGLIQYKAPVPMLYELVDDDDDHDAVPEWSRPWQTGSGGIAFPGVDFNRDFIYDYNQNNTRRPGGAFARPGEPVAVSLNYNRNLVPDYEEPFLRFRSDRPEFLFGVDMNHNGTADPFENDLHADYPYRRDHRGFNLHGKLFVTPDARLVAGRQRMRLISGDGRTESWYAMLAWTGRLGRSRLRLFDFGASVRDDIPDHLQTWVQPSGSTGRMEDDRDLLPSRDTWRNTFYADLDQRPGRGVRLFHRFKWETFRQRRDEAEVRLEERRTRSGFLGLINRAEWSIPVGRGLLEPRWKSEYRADRPYDARRPLARSLEESLFLMWRQPLLSELTSVNYYARYGKQLFDTELQIGLEWTRGWLLEGERRELDSGFTARTLIVQVINRVGFQGYQLVTRGGIQVGDRDPESGPAERSSLLFVSMNAGLQ